MQPSNGKLSPELKDTPPRQLPISELRRILAAKKEEIRQWMHEDELNFFELAKLNVAVNHIQFLIEQGEFAA